jgi:hypothetical protein
MVGIPFFLIGTILVIAGFVLIHTAFPRIASWPLLIAASAWGLATLYECWFELIFDPEAKFNIRVDLLAVLGVLLIVTPSTQNAPTTESRVVSPSCVGDERGTREGVAEKPTPDSPNLPSEGGADEK